MRIAFFIVALVFTLLGCSHRDPIDRLMAEVSKASVPSYMFRAIQLSATASPEQLISALIVRGDFEQKRITGTSVKILQMRSVNTTPPMPQGYTAVLLDTNLGLKIVLLQPLSSNGKPHGWYYRIYDAK